MAQQLETDIIWAEPPAAKSGAGTRVRHRFVEALQARPGEWAQYRPETGHVQGAAAALARAFPGVEAVQRTRPDGRADVYARWVGRTDVEAV